MAGSVCFYFQVHQPHRLRRYSVFDTDANYFDEPRNTQILKKVANKCYLPATRLILDLVRRHEGRFRVAYSLTGCVIEQFRAHCPEMIAITPGPGPHRLRRVPQRNLLTTAFPFLYSRDEFKAQIELHTKLMEDLFGQRPQVFRNTELIYSNELATYIASLNRVKGIIAEGADQILGYRSPNYLYWPPGAHNLKLLLKNYRLSDDIAFRFSNRGWSEWPLTADKFAKWVNQINGNGFLCNLFLDYETFGEHQWAETGIFDFIAALPGEIFKQSGGNDFKTPSQCIETLEPVGEYDVPHMISWADTERDLSAWLGNAMQSNALHEPLLSLEGKVKATPRIPA